MTEINREMFGEIHSILVEFPELHRQASWEAHPEDTGRCGTTRCIAGWATWIGARDHGLLSRKREHTTGEVRTELANLLGLTEGQFDSEWYFGDYQVHEYPVLGANLLGLTNDQAQSLFHDMHIERVHARVKSYAETGEDISDEEFDMYERRHTAGT